MEAGGAGRGEVGEEVRTEREGLQAGTRFRWLQQCEARACTKLRVRACVRGKADHLFLRTADQRLGGHGQMEGGSGRDT